MEDDDGDAGARRKMKMKYDGDEDDDDAMSHKLQLRAHCRRHCDFTAVCQNNDSLQVPLRRGLRAAASSAFRPR